MKKLTIVGDPHVTKHRISIMKKLLHVIEVLGNPVFWLGDQLDTKSIVHVECFNFWKDYLQKSPLHHFLLVGNHDLENNRSQRHSLEALAILKNVTVVDKVQEIESRLLYGIPYIHDQMAFKKILSTVPDNVILFLHAEVQGFDFGNGLIVQNECDLKLFSRFRRVISGHIHKHQTNGNFVYLGTPFSHSFGESNQKKMISVLDIEENKLDLIPTQLPQHRTLELNCDDVGENFDIPEPTHQGWKEDFWRLILTGSEESIHNFQLRGWMKKVGWKTIRRPDVLKSELQIAETSTPFQQFKQWSTEANSLSPKTVELGLNILNEVSNVN